MTNRLRNILRTTIFAGSLALLLCTAEQLQAQPDFFNFSYNGPATLSVGPTCGSMLQGNVPNPVVTSSMGFVITTSMFDPVQSGFQYNDLFTAGTVAHVYWYVEDNMGHSHTFEYFIFFEDNAPPAFDLNGVLDTLEFSSIVSVPPQTALPVSDNCTAVVNDTFYQTTPPDTCQSGTFTRTWMATDANGNTAVFEQTIIVYKDTLPPLITGYPQNGSAPCELLATAYPSWLANQISIFSATDASGVKMLVNNAPPAFPPGCTVPITVLFRAIDNCMIQQPVTVTFTTSDTEGPVVVNPLKDTVAYCSVSDNELLKLGEWISTKAYSAVYDSCSYPVTYSMKIGPSFVDSAQVVAAFLNSFANGCSTQMIGNQMYDKVHGRVSVDFIVTDDCGNQTMMGNADFGAIDTLKPVLSGINVTEQCGGGNDQTALQSWINAHGNAVVTDDCSGFTWTNFSFTTSTGQTGSGSFNAGPYPSVQANNCTWFTDVTFRATDDCGNSNTVTLRWSIVDTQVPVFTGLQPVITVYCPNPLPTAPAATVSDNCDANVAISFTRMYRDSLCDGSYTVRTTWIAADDCGNTSSALQDILVRDTTRPVFTLVPADKTFRCDTFSLPAPAMMGQDVMASDVCSPVLSITTAVNSLQDPDPAACGHYTYNIIRTFTATDECGNTQTATQTLFIVDNQGPVPGGILDTTALCSALTPFPAPVPLPVDACAGATAPPVQTGQSITPGACTDQYTIAVHWVASDVCGNTTAFDQLVHVIDTVPPTLMNIPPNITVECDAIPDPPNTAGFNANDNCDVAVTVTLQETEIRDPDPMSCAHWTDYIIKREWTATDNCGNSRTYTQFIQIEDTTPPAIIPPPAQTLPADPGVCGITMLIPAPLSVIDACSNQTNATTISETQFLVQSVPGNPNNTPVANLNFQLNAPNTAPLKPVVGNATLSILLDNADAEGPTEDFFVYDENGVLIGTADTDNQCGDKTTNMVFSAGQVNVWLHDGVIGFLMVPNGTGALACNPICPGGKGVATIDYTFASSDVPISLTYTLDGGASQNYPPPAPDFLPIGVHTIVYTATDCVGNSATASTQITVNDTQPPVITAPAPLTVYTGQNNCDGVFMLPFPQITENCTMSASLDLASAILPLHFENDPNVGLVASDVSVNLNGVIPNAVGTGVLRIRHKGDNAQLGEFFNIFDEFGNPLGSTMQGSVAGECNTFVETSIPVNANLINSWALTGGLPGNTSFYLESNRDLLNFSDFIGPCAALQPNMTDGMSQIQITLEYSYAVVDYTIKNASNQVVSSGNIVGTGTKDTLPPGNYTIMYNTTDDAGLSAMVSFALTVRDTVRPNAICQPTLTIFVNPSGAPASAYSLLPSEINNGSNDNCTPMPNLVYSVSPGSFICNQAGSVSTVTLRVTDQAGNSSTCTTIVRVENQKPLLAYSPVCEGGTLQLFCTPPTAAPNTYTYQWSGPVSVPSVQNPVISMNAGAIHNGSYCVTITGATLCTSTACIQVSLAILSTTPVLNGNGFSFCPGQNVVLTTADYVGQNVSYQWLMDSPSGLITLGTTAIPNFTLANLAPGSYTFYLRVFANGCNTALSNAYIITVHPTPPAAVDPTMIQRCECETISLHSTTPSSGGTLSYMWTGPSGFVANSQSPLVTNCASESQHEGLYTLITKQFGCSSNPVTVAVNIDPKPPKPSIGGNLQLCAGQPLTLVCSNTNASEWIWTSPTLTDYITNTNVLQIPSANNTHEGVWTVIVRSSNCYSDASAPITVSVQDYPNILAGSNAPICQDSLLKLVANFTANDPIVNWTWSGPPGFSRFEQNPVVPNGATGVYQVIGTTSFGCADTSTTSVTNVAPPIITDITHNAPSCCDNETDAVLSATINTANPPLTYLWTGPAAFGTSTVAGPVIPDICTPFAGEYTLVVKDSFLCPSLPATTTITISAPPVPPFISVSPHQPVCTDTTITINIQNPTPNATYVWDRPDPFPDTVTNTAYLIIPFAQPSQSGLYIVKAISAGGTCMSGVSNAVQVTINPVPNTPAAASNSPVCEGGIINLSASTIPGASYIWTGPGPVADIQNPVLQPATLDMAGEYRVKVAKDGCTSAEAFVFVNVVATPSQPFIAIPPAGICIDEPITAFLNIINPVNGMEYIWEDASSGIVLAGPSTAGSLNLADPNVQNLGPGAHTFRVRAKTAAAPGCFSPYSNAVSVNFDTIPAGVMAFAGQDRFTCIDSAILLQGNPLVGNVTGWWERVGDPGFTIFGATTPDAWFFGQADSVYTFTWSLSNGTCYNFSTASVTITAQAPEIADAGPDVYSCVLDGVELHAVQGQNTGGFWTQLQSQAGLEIVIDNPSDPNTTVSDLTGYQQTFVFFWNIGNEGCGVSSDPMTVYVYSANANGGPTLAICDDDNRATLTAGNIADFEIGHWSSPDPNLMFTNPNNVTTDVKGLAQGPNIVYWTINNGICGINSRDTVIVNYALLPTAVDDAVTVPFGGTVTFDVLANDVVPASFKFTFAEPAAGRLIDTLAVGKFIYRPQSGFTGSETMTYTLESNLCPGVFVSATVTFTVGSAPECFIPTVITPNGDGFNDVFTIPSVCTLGEGAADLDVSIYNQWGDLVFHEKPYLNNWGGTYNNEELPAGTYFYIVRINEVDEPKSGFLLIQR